MTNNDIQKLEELVKSLPDNGKLRLALGKAYLAASELEKAITELELAVEYDSDNPEALLKLGNALAEKQDYELAIGNYRKALNIDSYYVEAFYCLGMAYVDTNNKEDVEKIIKRLEQLHPIWAQGLKSYYSKIL